MSYLYCLLIFIIYINGCSSEVKQKSLPPRLDDSTIAADYFWRDCAWLNAEELDKADNLLANLRTSSSLAQDQGIFKQYLNLLTLVGKSDVQIESCVPATRNDRDRLTRHFIFLGLAYGKGEFSFVNNPRLASLFEMDYFYFYYSRHFLDKTLSNLAYSEADKRLANYLLGALIIMQASVVPKQNRVDSSTLADKVTENLSYLKYGYSRVFIKNIAEIQDSLKEKVSTFLLNTMFINSIKEMSGNTSAKIYPVFLKESSPYWPLDYSEVLAARSFPKESNMVVCLTFGGMMGSCRGTGFFARRNNKNLFITAGHGQFKKKVSIMKQADPLPERFGQEKSKLTWVDEQLDIFNFAEDLLVPIFKALDFDNSQVQRLRNKLGDNPFASSFKEFFINVMPWIDMAIALPSNNILSKSGVMPSNMLDLGSWAPELAGIAFSYNIGFGISEDLVSGDISKNKSFGFRKFRRGRLVQSEVKFAGKGTPKLIFYSPQKFDQINSHTGFSTFSMRFAEGFSGSPIFFNNHIIGLMQAGLTSNGAYIGDAINSFSDNTLGLIDDLINDARGLHAIPEADLIALVRKHIYKSDSARAEMRAKIASIYFDN